MSVRWVSLLLWSGFLSPSVSLTCFTFYPSDSPRWTFSSLRASRSHCPNELTGM